MWLSVCDFELQKSLYTGPRQWSNIFQISISVLSSRTVFIWWKTLQWCIRILFKSSRNETWNDWLSHKKVRAFYVELNSIQHVTRFCYQIHVLQSFISDSEPWPQHAFYAADPQLTLFSLNHLWKSNYWSLYYSIHAQSRFNTYIQLYCTWHDFVCTYTIIYTIVDSRNTSQGLLHYYYIFLQ